MILTEQIHAEKGRHFMDACLEKCACRGSYLDKFLQPAILVVLQRGSSHGFQMISDLEKSGMVSGNGLDPA